MTNMRTITIIIGLFCSVTMMSKTSTDSTRADRDPLYFQLFGGINKSANENLPWTEFSAYPWSVGAFAAMGREFNRLWGWRVALRINHNKSRNVQECESKDVWGWNSTALFGDVTFDVTDMLNKRKTDYDMDSIRNKKFNLKAFAGLGGSYTWGFDKVPLSYSHAYSRSSRLVPAIQAGITATWRLSDRWRIGAELSQTLFEDHFNGVAYDAPLDARTNLKVGLTYLLVKKVKKKKKVLRKIRLKECPPLPMIMPDPEDIKRRVLSGHAFLDFPVNETIIYPQYRKNPEELAKIKASIDSVMFDKSVVVTRITLHGYASPESPYSNNTRLAKGRTESLKNYLMRHFNFHPGVFQTDYTPEDWDNLKGFLLNTDSRKIKGSFWYDSQSYEETPEAPAVLLEHSEELLQIIDRQMDADAKEELLKRVAGGEPYRWLLQYVYPGLRHTDYTIEYQVKAYPVEKGRKLIYTHPEAMSLEEMYNVAMSYEEKTDDWLDALMIAARQFPEDPAANLNAACGCVMTNRLTDAKYFLKKAGTLKETRYVRDVIKAMEGDVHWKIESKRVVVIDE